MDVLDGIDRHWGEVRGSAGAWLLAYTLGKAGRRAEFDQLVSVLERRVEEGTAGWTELALSFMGIGDHARALDYFERAPDQRPPGSDQSSYANIFPHFDPIRDDPRFQEVMRRIGPPEAASAPL